MPDREKVMEALRICAGGCREDGCSYLPSCDWLSCDDRCIGELAADALELLEEEDKKHAD